MPKRRPERDEAFKIFKEKRGKITPSEIAEQLGVSANTVRKWKCTDEWEKQLRKRGGAPKGNQNAKGNQGGAPKGNTNAETHGAYSMPNLERFGEEQRAWLQALVPEFQTNAATALRMVMAKLADLEEKIAAVEQADDDALFLDRAMKMEMPAGGTMDYEMKSSKASVLGVLRAEQNRWFGRLTKLLDSFRNAEAEQRRLELEKMRLNFQEQKALGKFSVDENGNLLLGEEETDDSVILE